MTPCSKPLMIILVHGQPDTLVRTSVLYHSSGPLYQRGSGTRVAPSQSCLSESRHSAATRTSGTARTRQHQRCAAGAHARRCALGTAAAMNGTASHRQPSPAAKHHQPLPATAAAPHLRARLIGAGLLSGAAGATAPGCVRTVVSAGLRMSGGTAAAACAAASRSCGNGGRKRSSCNRRPVSAAAACARRLWPLTAASQNPLPDPWPGSSHGSGSHAARCRDCEL